jgi:hypothetical protein
MKRVLCVCLVGCGAPQLERAPVERVTIAPDAGIDGV